MALITKQLLVCNKCGKEVADGSPNMTILGEEFYLCDECLERLLNWVSQPTIQEIDLNKLAAKLDTPPQDTFKKPKSSTRERFSSTNIIWDEYNIDKVLSMVEKGMTNADIGSIMCTTEASIMCLLNRIKYSKPGSEKYPYRDRLLKVSRRRGKNAKHIKKEGDD